METGTKPAGLKKETLWKNVWPLLSALTDNTRKPRQGLLYRPCPINLYHGAVNPPEPSRVQKPAPLLFPRGIIFSRPFKKFNMVFVHIAAGQDTVPKVAVFTQLQAFKAYLCGGLD